MRKHHCLVPGCKEVPEESGFCERHWKKLQGPKPRRILPQGAAFLGVRVTEEAKEKLEAAGAGVYKSAYAVGSRVLEEISAEDIKKLL